MKDSKHTLTPWEMDDVDGCASITTDRSADICTEICYLSGLADLDQNAANGRFIVLACNHFDEMKAELMRLRNEFKFVGDYRRANRINKIMDKLEVPDAE